MYNRSELSRVKIVSLIKNISVIRNNSNQNNFNENCYLLIFRSYRIKYSPVNVDLLVYIYGIHNLVYHISF